ncbi:MAG: hypothetical protein Q9213_002328 [Squamulea squamosa]
MHATLFGLVLATATLCSGRPGQSSIFQTRPLNSLGVSLGFSAEYLPPIRPPTANTSDSLTVPIVPSLNPKFHAAVEWGYHDAPPNGIGLATSITQNIYYAWKDIANHPLTNPVWERENPFDQYQFTIRPLSTILTPEKVGLANMWIFHDLLLQNLWPGHILAVIFEREGQTSKQIGTINIDNNPLVLGKRDSISAAATNSSANELTALSSLVYQQRWLRCFLVAVGISIRYAPVARVTDNPFFPPKPKVQKYPWHCGTAGAADRLDLFVYPDANAGTPTELTWQMLMSELISWIIKVARGQDAGRSMKVIKERRLVAEISVFIQQGG